MSEYGKRICQLRQERGLSQRQLGLKVGVNQQQISFMENGSRRVSFELAIKLAAALDVTVNDLASENEEVISVPSP